VLGSATAEIEPDSKIECVDEWVDDHAGGVLIERNYMRFDMDIFPVLAEMAGAEAKVYLDFIRRTYGQVSPRNICSCTHPMIIESTGITSRETLARVINSLEKKGFVKRLFMARTMKERSMYRVFLPGELPGRQSRTVIRFKTGEGIQKGIG
jgi:hypothetical protein